MFDNMRVARGTELFDRTRVAETPLFRHKRESPITLLRRQSYNVTYLYIYLRIYVYTHARIRVSDRVST